jgi:hypothetical protein
MRRNVIVLAFLGSAMVLADVDHGVSASSEAFVRCGYPSYMEVHSIGYLSASASCFPGGVSLAEARVNTLKIGELFVEAWGGDGPHYYANAYVDALFWDTLTITGGVGEGHLLWDVEWDAPGSVFSLPFSFVYGEPFRISVEAHAGGGYPDRPGYAPWCYVKINGLSFIDEDLNPIYGLLHTASGYRYGFPPDSTVPEPSSVFLLACGGLVLLGAARRTVAARARANSGDELADRRNLHHQ